MGKKKSAKEKVKKSKAVLMDMDMTLIDWVEAATAAYNEVRARRGKKKVSSDYVRRELVEAGYLEGFRKQGFSEKEISQVSNEYMYALQKHTGKISVYEGVPEFLHEMKQKGKKLAVVTNNYRKPGYSFLKRVVEEYNMMYSRNETIHSLFDYVGFADDSGNSSKPSAIPLERALSKLRVSASSSVLIGDSWQDSVGGKKAGIETIGVMNQYDRIDKFRTKPDYIATSTTSLSNDIVGGLEHKLAA